MKTFDVVVIGAGPGGSAAAILAAQNGARVLLLERGSFPRHKVCGEFVSAESLALLGILLGSEASALLDPAVRIDRARLFLDGEVVESGIHPAAVSVARHDLDAALWKAAGRSGVATRDHVTVSRVDRTDPYLVISSAGNFQARAVIDASGRWSNLRTKPSTAGPKWLGIKRHFREARPSRSVDLYFFEGGYCGIQPVELEQDGCRGQRVNACAMVRADRATDLAQVFSLHSDLQARADDWLPLMDPVVTSPLIFRKPTPLCNELFLVGDAAGFVDPFVGDGISLALRSGAMAAECLRTSTGVATALKAYSERYTAELGPIFQASSALRRMLALPSAIRKPGLILLKNSKRLKRYIVQRTRRAS